MSNLEGEFALVDFLESAREDGIGDDTEARIALYQARERIAKATGHVALFDVEIEI